MFGAVVQEAVRQPGRDPELPANFGVQRGRYVVAEGGRVAAQIHRDIQNGATQDADQLVLGIGLKLEVQAANGAGGNRQ